MKKFYNCGKTLADFSKFDYFSRYDNKTIYAYKVEHDRPISFHFSNRDEADKCWNFIINIEKTAAALA